MEEFEPKITTALDDVRRRHNSFTLFWLGFTIYSISFPMVYGFPDAIRFFAYTQLIGLLLFITGAVRLFQLRIENRYLRIVFWLYLCWIMVIIFRGLSFERSALIEMFFHPQLGIMLYFVPFVLLLPPELHYLKRAFVVILIMELSFIVYMAFILKEALFLQTGSGSFIEFVSALCIPAGFLLINFLYQSRFRIIVSIAVLLLMLFEASIRARRGLIFMSVALGLIAYLNYFITNRGRILVFVFSLIVVAAVVYWGVSVFEHNRADLFQLIANRWNEDTRSEVTTNFFKAMGPTDWIIGKGLQGSYFSPGIESTNKSMRTIIETGYLQMMLKGGIVYLVIYLLMCFPAMINLLFFSRNALSRGAGLWILLGLVALYPRNVVAFTMENLLFWISVGIGYNNQIRQMEDSEIAEILKPQRIREIKPKMDFN